MRWSCLKKLEACERESGGHKIEARPDSDSVRDENSGKPGKRTEGREVTEAFSR